MSIRKRRPGRFAGALFALIGWVGSGLAWAMILPNVAEAALQRVEAVGIYGIRERFRSKVIPRDEAVQAALWEGVSRVAADAISEFASTEEDVSALKEALGSDMLPYTRSFRILEDKGESPVLFADDPAVSVEYIVVVEMWVDVDRVEAALEQAGLVAEGDSLAASEPIFVELIGIGRYRDFEAIRDALASQLGATRVDRLGFARERQLLSVVGPFGTRELSAALARLDAGEWTLEPIGIDEEGRRIRVRGRRVAPFTPE